MTIEFLGAQDPTTLALPLCVEMVAHAQNEDGRTCSVFAVTFLFFTFAWAIYLGDASE